VSSVDPIRPEVSASARTSLLTQREVATQLRVTPRTVRRWDRAGLLQPIRLGGVTRYRADAITALIDPSNDTSPPGTASSVTVSDAEIVGDGSS
jgi:hypothetical protein